MFALGAWEPVPGMTERQAVQFFDVRKPTSFHGMSVAAPHISLDYFVSRYRGPPFIPWSGQFHSADDRALNAGVSSLLLSTDWHAY